MPIIVGAQWAGTSSWSHISDDVVAQVRVWDGVMTEADLAATFAAEKGRYGL